MAAEKKNEVAEQKVTDLISIAIDNNFINGLIGNIKTKEQYGLTFPKGYNYTNALTGAYLTLLETKDKNDKPALQVCSQQSIVKAMMDLATLGLDTQKKQAYFVAYGGSLSLQKSYFGNETIARRYGARKFSPQIVYEGDDFSYDIVDGEIQNITHKQQFKNIDITKIVAAYCIIQMEDGSKYAEVMNIDQIKQAWKQGYGYKENGNGTHQKFTDQMCKKTVINRACKSIINTFGDSGVSDIYNEVEEHESDDVVAIQSQHEIKENENSEDFVVESEYKEVEAEKVQGEVEDSIPSDVPYDESMPDFMKG